MSLTVKTSDLNSFGVVVMDGDVAVALCRPIEVLTKGEDGGPVSRVVTPEEALKNAYLFAAAPEMLAMLLIVMESDIEMPQNIWDKWAELKKRLVGDKL